MSTAKFPYACAFCEESFDTARALVSHVKTKHESVEPSNDKIEHETEEIRNEVENSLMYQSKNHKKDKVKVTNNTSEETGKRRDIKFYSCKTCEKILPTYTSLYQHERIHKEKKHSCTFCKKMFLYKNLDGHLKTHTNEKNFDCSFCDMKFILKKNKNLHERIHTGKCNDNCGIS